MEAILEIELHHIEKAAEAIVAAREAGDNEMQAVEEYCANKEITCLRDLFCLAIGLVARKRIEKYINA